MKKVLLILLAVVGFHAANAQSYNLHPLYIYSFTKYVQWPEAYNQGDFEIMVLGESPIFDELNKMAQAKKVGDRAIKVSKIPNASGLKKCNILFVPSRKSGELADILAKIGTQSILVITEEPGLGAKGSNINFIVKDGKLAFELNQSAFGKQSLKVSNELTRLAILI
jgi:hypothetical protein